MNKMNVHFEDLVYYHVVTNTFFKRHYNKYGANHPDSFKISYYFSDGMLHGQHKFYIEENLYNHFIKLENK